MAARFLSVKVEGKEEGNGFLYSPEFYDRVATLRAFYDATLSFSLSRCSTQPAS